MDFKENINEMKQNIFKLLFQFYFETLSSVAKFFFTIITIDFYIVDR